MESISSILEDHYADPYHRGPCDQPNFAAQKKCEESACQLRIELSISAEGEIREAWFDGEGCSCCESLASVLVETIEGQTADAASRLTPQTLLELAGATRTETLPGCYRLAVETLQLALDTNLDATDDDGTNFGGPSLREEC